MEIAPCKTVADWRKLKLDEPNHPDWGEAISIFEARIRARYLKPIEVLIREHERNKLESTGKVELHYFGFAILALDCLLIETLQGFQEGVPNHRGRSAELFTRWLTSNLPGTFDDGVHNQSKASTFYVRCRCALHHSGQTDGDLRIGRSGPAVSFKGDDAIRVNRTEFHDVVCQAFEAYLFKLRSADPELDQLRQDFRTKMEVVCGNKPNRKAR